MESPGIVTWQFPLSPQTTHNAQHVGSLSFSSNRKKGTDSQDKAPNPHPCPPPQPHPAPLPNHTLHPHPNHTHPHQPLPPTVGLRPFSTCRRLRCRSQRLRCRSARPRRRTFPERASHGRSFLFFCFFFFLLVSFFFRLFVFSHFFPVGVFVSFPPRLSFLFLFETVRYCICCWFVFSGVPEPFPSLGPPKVAIVREPTSRLISFGRRKSSDPCLRGLANLFGCPFVLKTACRKENHVFGESPAVSKEGQKNAAHFGGPLTHTRMTSAAHVDQSKPRRLHRCAECGQFLPMPPIPT